MFKDWDAQYAQKGLKRAVYFLDGIRRFHEFKDKMTLDLGCGNGYQSIEAAKMGSAVVSLDIRYRFLKDFTGSRVFRERINVVVADATRLPFRSDIFDVVFSYDLYEHVGCQGKLMDEKFRAARCGGLVSLVTGNRLFPVDRHSDLWFIDILPRRLADVYVRRFRGWKGYDIHEPTFWSLRRELLRHTQRFVVVGEAVLEMFPRVYPETYGRLGAGLMVVLEAVVRLGLIKFFSPKYFVFARKPRELPRDVHGE